ncbi:uncharacterized protein UV8b_06935 [Ustilaginoidea virens]|uniref:Uncharacterized protein n=1 Tax=Ustilaginoidea virens TaxID=1159556 RepID=A0A8E5HWT8_USTVR|nr:uncharacterized protein UV8b_06935 [Ustilaginoidea virens]QUC22694.1 hypothetical protein UV8b_06935 [Ustilaginoidea virens]
MAAEFRPLVAPLDEPPAGDDASLTVRAVRAVLAHRHKVFAAAAAQLLVSTLFPGRFAVVPIATLAGLVATAELVHLLTPAPPKPPPQLRAVVPGRATPQLPRADGSFPAPPASPGQPVVLFLLGVQFNHPRGRAGPHARALALRFRRLNASLHERRAELGLLGCSEWAGGGGGGGGGGGTLLFAYYFRDVESVHRFAHGEAHREAWEWYAGAGAEHMGIFHETYAVPAHAWEAVYVNCRPELLGAGVVRCDGVPEGQGGGWRNTLVSADHPALRSQWRRMNRDAGGVPRG